MVNTLKVYKTYENCKFAKKDDTHLISGKISAINVIGAKTEHRMLVGCEPGGCYYTLSRAIIDKTEYRPDAFRLSEDEEPVLIPVKKA